MTSLVSHILHRIHRLRDLAARERASGDGLRVMRLKALQLKAQKRLADILLPQPQLRPIPVRVSRPANR